MISAVFKVRKEPTAEAWFAAIRERSRFGIAIAAMIRIIATTINSSIREKPLELFFIQSSSGKTKLPLGNFQVNGTPERLLSQSPAPNPWIRRWSGRDKCFRHCLGDAPGLARRLAKYLRSSRSTLTPTTTSQSEVAVRLATSFGPFPAV